MKLLPNFDCRIALENSDISSFVQLNGVTKIYMYDKVFRPDLKSAIAKIINNSCSIRFIASTTKDLEDYGFEVKFVKQLGSLPARGGNMSHTFYIYETCHRDPDRSTWIIQPRMENLIEIASNKVMRFELLKTNVDAVHNSERYTRSKEVTNNLIADSRCGVEAGKALYKMLIEIFPVIINGVDYSRTFKTKRYATYNETEYSKAEYDIKILACLQKTTAVLAPSWDGKEDGKILLQLTRRTHKKNNPYTGVVYNISTDTFEELPVYDIFGQFDHEFKLPSSFDAECLLEVIIVVIPLYCSRSLALFIYFYPSLSLSLSLFLSISLCFVESFSHSFSHSFIHSVIHSVIHSENHSVIQ
jgi:hypothetical protein